MKRLTRDKNDALLFGVCSGLAKYLEVDVVLVRLIWILGFLFGGLGLVAYFIIALIMPSE